MQKDSIKINVLMSFILTFSNCLFPIISYGYVARVLSVDGTGKVSFVLSIIGLLTSIAALGIPGFGTRECAKVREDREKLSKLVQELFFINCAATVIIYIILALSIIFIPKLHPYTVLFIVMAPSIILNTLGVEWLFRALEKYTYITIRSVVFKAISVLLIILLIRSPKDVVIYGTLMVFATSASNILNFIYARKFVNFSRYSDYEFSPFIKPLMYFFATTLIITIYGHSDVIMLGLIKGDSEVGLYNAALKFKTATLSISVAATSVLIPRMSIYSAKGNESSFNNLLGNSLRLTCLLMLPIVAFISLNTKDLILLLCGGAFSEAFSTAALLNASVLLLSIANLLGNQIIIPRGRENVFFQAVTISLFINLFFNFLLIPYLGADGAAVATLGAEFFNVIWMGRHSMKEIKELVHNVNIFMYVLPLLFSMSISFGIFYLLPFDNIIIRVSCNAVVLFGSFYLFLLWIKEPILYSVFERAKDLKKRFL